MPSGGHEVHVGNQNIGSKPSIVLQEFCFVLAEISHLWVEMKNSLNPLLLIPIREDIYSVVVQNLLVLNIYGF